MSNQWQGKLWYAYGTSMTSVQQGKFVPVVEKLSGMTVVNKGIPGGCLTPDGYGKGNVKAAVLDKNDGKEKADLITLEVLPNEGAKVGNIYDTDDESFCGCFNQCLRFLQENTKATIVVIIMIGSNDNPPDKKHDSRKITQFEFSETIKKVARLNSVPVIDVFGESGFGYARVKNRDYQLDNIHLNDLGGINIGKFVWSKLKDIPVWETNIDSKEG
jgi:lysophospholipase L1-like esterase